jgi:hypothetical protein
MYEHVHQQISVTASFLPGQRPVISQIEWQGKKYKIEATTLVTHARRGREAVWLFHVMTKTASFKLRLDTDSLTWWLEELTWDIEQDQ